MSSASSTIPPPAQSKQTAPTTKLNQFAVSAIPPFAGKGPATTTAASTVGRPPINYAAAASTKSKPSPPAVNGKDVSGSVIGNSTSSINATVKPVARAEAVTKVNEVKPVEVNASAKAAAEPTPATVAPKAALNLHSFFGATAASSSTPAPAPAPSMPSVISMNSDNRPPSVYDPSARSPQPTSSILPNHNGQQSLSNLNHALSSNSRPFAPGTQSFVPQQQQHLPFPPQYNNQIPPPTSYQQQQQQHSPYMQNAKSSAQNIPNGNNNNNGNNNSSYPGGSLGGGPRSSSFASPVMQHQQAQRQQQQQQQQQQLGNNQGRTQFPTSPRTLNAGLPNQQSMMYQGQQWQPQPPQQVQGYLSQQQQQQQSQPQPPYPFYAHPANYPAPPLPSGTSTPSAGLRTPSTNPNSLPPNATTPIPSLANAVSAPQFSPAVYPISPLQSAAILPQHSMQFSSPASIRALPSQSPFSLSSAAAAEFRPSIDTPKRKSAAIKIVNPKDHPSPLKTPYFPPKTPAVVAEVAVEDPAIAAKKVEEEKKAEEEKASIEAEQVTKAATLAAEKAAVAASAAAAVAAKVESDRVEKEHIASAAAKAQAEKDAAPVVTPAPASTPIISAAASTSLPTKPVNGATVPDSVAKKIIPAPLDLLASKSASVAAPLPSALLTARVIDNLKDVTYPGDIKSPRPDLNIDAQPGKFRYDRDFLMQFMLVCQEKPEQLPNLESIGMVDSGASNGGGGGGSAGGFRRTSSSMGPPTIPNRGGPGAPAGGFGGNRAASMGQFAGGMGNFGGSGISSSEDRFKASLAGGSRSSSTSGAFATRSGGSMSRTSSQSGTIVAGSNFVPSSASQGGQSRIRSNRGKPRGHEGGGGGGGGGGKPGQHTTGQGFEDAAPLEATANRWTPTVVGAPGAIVASPDSPEMVQRKVKALLNKLTLEKFDSISEQILAWANKSEDEVDGRILRQVIALIFEKATDEATWSAMYAQLCRKLMETVSTKVTDESVKQPDGTLFSGGSLFRKYLLNRCQEDYESGWKQKEVAAAAAAVKAADDNAKKETNVAAEKEEKEGGASNSAPKEAELLSDEYYAAQKAKRRGLGLVRFIGELFRLSMLTERIMHECIKKLLSTIENPDEEDIESLCRLLTTVGQGLDSPKAKAHMDIYFSRMNTMIANMKISSRIRFMLQDVVELRKGRWQPRHASGGPKLISEIHSDAQKASEEASRRTASSSGKGLPRLQDQLSRPGSRRGQGRDAYGPPSTGPDGWSVPTPQRPAKAGDLGNFGHIRDSGATASLGGPSGHFAKGGKAAKAKEAIRSTTPSNPFAALEAAPVADTPPAPQRQRIIMAPRTITKEGGADIEKTDDVKVEATADEEEGEVEEEEEEEDDGAIDPNAVSMSRAEGVRRSGNSVKEFFSVKSLAEGVASVEGLPSEYRGILVAAFAEAVMDQKADLVKLTSSLFAAVASKNIVSHAVFLSSLTPTIVGLIDISIDVPQAFAFATLLLVGGGITRDEVVALSALMASEEEDEETVEESRLKLVAAFDKSVV